jgi:hypothetical protein
LAWKASGNFSSFIRKVPLIKKLTVI